MTREAEKKVLIMAGGTGGHIYPGLALARELNQRNWAVEWLGTLTGLEKNIVPAAGYTLNAISISGIRGKGLKALLMAPYTVVRALFESIQVIRKIGPKLVIGLGGFASGPGGVAAKLLRIPLIVHEQNAVPGTTNKLLAVFANRVLMGFPNALGKGVFIGNPIRPEIETVPSPEQRFSNRTSSKIRLLVLGGSRGARALNQLVPAALKQIQNAMALDVKHQTGEALHDEAVAEYKLANVEAEVLPFIENMAATLAWADLVVCRAGALTIAELAAVGVGSILIPFPFAIDDHQTKNAQYLSEDGAAIVMQQKNLNQEKLAEVFLALLSDRTKLLNMAIAAKKKHIPGASTKFADICGEILDDNR